MTRMFTCIWKDLSSISKVAKQPVQSLDHCVCSLGNSLFSHLDIKRRKPYLPSINLIEIIMCWIVLPLNTLAQFTLLYVEITTKKPRGNSRNMKESKEIVFALDLFRTKLAPVWHNIVCFQPHEIRATKLRFGFDK